MYFQKWSDKMFTSHELFPRKLFEHVLYWKEGVNQEREKYEPGETQGPTPRVSKGTSQDNH